MSNLRNYFFISLLACAVASTAFAQAVPDPVQYLVAPETPGPNSQVIINVEGVGTFLGDATITWTQDGKVVLSGVGERQYSFVTGALGVQTRIQVRIVSSTQGTITRSFVFTPSLISLVWEADTSAPPLYRGKSLYTGGSQLKVVAFPTIVVAGARIGTKSISYQWFRNGESVPSASGLGRDSFSFVGDQLQTQENIAVDAYLGGSKIGRGEISIPAQNPQVLLYVKDPLRGMMYDAALPDAISLSAKEVTLQATPYFFSNASLKNGTVAYGWSLNDNDVVGPESAKGILTLRQTSGGTGGAVLKVSLQDNDDNKLIQAAQAAVQIVFGQSNTSLSSFFGI